MAADLAPKICKQVEFYFSDSNISKDKFLKGKVGENPEGWVPIEVIAKFNRMKQMSEDINVITDALKAAESDLLEVSEDGKNIRRTKPVPGEYDDVPTSIYAKGFPTDIAQATIEEFWNGVSEKVKAVRLRRTFKEREQKDSCFVEFDSAEERDRVLGMELKHDETPLKLEAKGAYQERKRAERKEMWAEKKRQEKLAKEEEALEGSFVPNAIIAFSFETAPESLKREDIKEAFGKHAIVNWVDYSMGGKDGFIRLEKDAKETVAKLEEEKTELAGLVPVLRVLEGDEERSYWLQLLESKKQLKKKGHGHGNKQQGGGSKRGVKRDAEDDEESEEPAEKVAKTEA